MRVITVVLLLAGTGLAAACKESSVLEPDGRAAAVAADRSSAVAKISVLTRNLYVGTDVDAVIAALATGDPNDDLVALVGAIETLGKTDFPARAAAIADEIARARPDAVGLQEVSQIDLTLPPLGVNLHLDFLPTILAQLNARGLAYDVAASVRNIEAAPFPGVSLVDFDVLLVRHGVPTNAAEGHSFAANVGPIAPGVELKRGWVTARLTVGGRNITVASTHLESGPAFGEFRRLQAEELVTTLQGEDRVIIMGDLNDAPGSPMYQELAGAGYIDAWRELRPGVVGNTCCHAGDLSNKLPNLTQRIDYVFARGLDRAKAGLIGKIERLGEVPADRIAGPASRIWPSDHAGLAAEL